MPCGYTTFVYTKISRIIGPAAGHLPDHPDHRQFALRSPVFFEVPTRHAAAYFDPRLVLVCFCLMHSLLLPWREHFKFILHEAVVLGRLQCIVAQCVA
mmetsp:Transcript_32633/g.107620  ORF Transcript_32633/g.107620 Transcript_32633/m.107620 type:complete len:98 (+) Transcript_32633:470-763(+)